MTPEQFRAHQTLERPHTPCWWCKRSGLVIPVVFPVSLTDHREPITIRSCTGHIDFTRRAVVEHPDLDWAMYK